MEVSLTMVSSGIGGTLCKHDLVKALEVFDVRFDTATFRDLSHIDLISLNHYEEKPILRK